MLIPQITFNETSVGSRPILPNLRNRIGILGQFSRGPANIFSFIDGYTEFANVYGSDNKSGSIGYQAAWDQGARDFALIRVLGHGQAASGTFNVAGNAQKDNTLTLNITGTQDIVLANGTVFDMEVSNTNSNYEGTGNGHYVVKVTKVDEVFDGSVYVSAPGVVEVKYKFVPLTTAATRLEAIDYVTNAVLATITETPPNPSQGVFYLAYDKVSDTTTYVATYTNAFFVGDLSVITNTSSNVAVDLGDGLNLVYGDTAHEALYLEENDIFTFKVESFTYEVNVNNGDTSVDVTNRILNTLQGADPLGEVSLNTEFSDTTVDNYLSTIVMEMDQNIEAVSQELGNSYKFIWDLETPDGLIYLKDSAWIQTTDDTILYSADPDAGSLVAGDELSIISGAVETLTFTNLTVTTVTPDAGGITGLYEIQLSGSIASTGVGNEGSLGATVALSTLPLTVSFTSVSGSGLQISGAKEIQSFSGGTEGPQAASRYFYTLNGQRILKITAASPGQWGSNLLLSISPIGNSSYRLDVSDPAGKNLNPPIQDESYVIDLTDSEALDDRGEINALKDSYLIRGEFPPKVDNPQGFNVNLLSLKPERLAPVNTDIAGANTASIYHPSYFGVSKLKDISLEEGYDGPIITEDDYVLAAEQFEGRNVNILFMPGVSTTFKRAQAQLVSIAESGTELDGLKIAVLNAKKGLRPQAAANEFKEINSQRAVLVTGWSTYAGQAGVERYGLSPDAIYAGKLATIGFTVSPAARSTAGPVRNITEVDTAPYTGRSSLQLYTDGRMEVLFPELQLGGFYFLNGRTSSSDTAWDRIVIRRTYDVIRQDLFIGLQPYKSEPHTALLRRQIETSVNAYFANLARNSKIANFTPAVCNASNNPPENYINGEVNIDISFLPLYAADYININIQRDTDSGLRIDVG